VDHVNAESVGSVAAQFGRLKLTDAAAGWWHSPLDLLASFEGLAPTSPRADRYRIVDADLEIDSFDSALRVRFRQLFAECVSRNAGSGKHYVRCRMQSVEGAPAHLVTFTGPAFNFVDFALDLFGDRGYLEVRNQVAGWRGIRLAGEDDPILLANGNRVLVAAHKSWQSLVANCAFNWAMSIQRDLLFFHAAAVSIDDRGVLFVGSKGSGKTTLSMAVASRGCVFLSDEIAAVRTPSHELIPVRRALSVRPGLRSAAVEELLRRRSYPTEQFPDGSARIRTSASEVFPLPLEQPVSVCSIFFLLGFEDRPRIEAARVAAADVQLLTPLRCVFWGLPPALRFMQVANLLSTVKCYYLYPGLPDETAALVERTVRL
jgi:hypothetical protein